MVVTSLSDVETPACVDVTSPTLASIEEQLEVYRHFIYYRYILEVFHIFPYVILSIVLMNMFMNEMHV